MHSVGLDGIADKPRKETWSRNPDVATVQVPGLRSGRSPLFFLSARHPPTGWHRSRSCHPRQRNLKAWVSLCQLAGHTKKHGPEIRQVPDWLALQRSG